MAWALHLLTEHPDQRELLLADFAGHIDNTIDEVIRFASPVPYMRRTATVDTELGGAHIAAGDKVVMWYLSANHDERIFDGPGRFDSTRWVNRRCCSPRSSAASPHCRPGHVTDGEVHAGRRPEIMTSGISVMRETCSSTRSSRLARSRASSRLMERPAIQVWKIARLMLPRTRGAL
ncbi:cytochrome P450 family protein [Rhodococcus opacus]|uniref:Cytochrome P450 family protein n=1 Tax=Rhodococcus opacus TaxID=37919 RepID=A0A1B1JX23_RHOOP|nr:cytochrome P450 family protein [Rhodococcus opacus]